MTDHSSRQRPVRISTHIPQGWVNIKGAATYASVSARIIRTWIKKGLKHSRENRKMIRIRPEDIDTFLFQFYSDKHPDLADLQVDALLKSICK